PGTPDCSVSTAIVWVELRLSQNVAGADCGGPPSSVNFNPWRSVCITSARSGWNVAVVLIVLFAVTPCARPPPSFHDTNTNRELLSVGCGDGASSQCAVPWSHHKLAGTP